jgi:hypothetical protein
MEKMIIGIFLMLSISSSGVEIKNSCIECHQSQKIPSELIYRRYLMRYSDSNIIKDKIFLYLQNPTKESSIMPKQFFLKFPMKMKTDLNSITLKYEIEEYLKLFDIKRRLILNDN